MSIVKKAKEQHLQSACLYRIKKGFPIMEKRCLRSKQMSLQSRAGDPEDHRRLYLFLLFFRQVF